MEKFSGVVSRILFYNEENGYSVIEFESEGAILTAVGNAVKLNVGEKIELEGEWADHPKYGMQIRFKDIATVRATDLDGIRNYLSGGLVTGIGPVRAEELLNMFGEEVLDIIENDYEQLTKVRGIGMSTALSIHNSYMQHINERYVVMELSKIGLSVNMSLKLFKRYGKSAVDVVYNDPYRLIDDVDGIGFLRADAIAAQIGFDPNSPTRISAAIRYRMSINSLSGNTYILYEDLIDSCANALGITEDDIEELLSKMIDSGKVIMKCWGEEQRCFLRHYYECEYISAIIIDSLINSHGEDIESVWEMIEQYETYTGITLAEEQRMAVKTAVSNRFSVITGGPGTGKTTIIKAIVYILRRFGKSFALAAPTGRAAKRMSEACSEGASTIHRLLRYEYSGEDDLSFGSSFGRNEENHLDYDVIIVDEISMVDAGLLCNLLKAVDTDRTSLVFVGDARQLPSIGAGNVLSDLLKVERVPKAELKQVFRQSEQSLIVRNAHRINDGLLPEISMDNSEFAMFSIATQQKIAAAILKMIEKNSFNSRNMLLEDKLQILSPFKKGEAGIINLNTKIQDIINPLGEDDAEVAVGNYRLRVNDKVMQTKNDYNLPWTNINTHEQGKGVFNGDMGYVSHIDRSCGEVHVLYEGERRVIYDSGVYDSLTLAYAITIHKSQGSEFDSVIIPVYAASMGFLTRNIIYTAVTRAKKQVILIGENDALRRMIQNDKSAQRLSALDDMLLDMSVK
ncbi:MAG: ATP-dependent RecD-like DNA helicase [Anaerofustis stercorihominis]|nr:ATP-dependent RecD-like DNA helicase [Anaerofustis stercorihominis]